MTNQIRDANGRVLPLGWQRIPINERPKGFAWPKEPPGTQADDQQNRRDLIGRKAAQLAATSAPNNNDFQESISRAVQPDSMRTNN
jgi:hypothetical protein